MKKTLSLLFAGLMLFAAQSQAAMLVEDFEDAFPAWEAGWLGTNSNVTNYYGVGGGRGNNPDGLWISDGVNDRVAEITFDSGFGSTIVDFSIDVTTWVYGAVFEAYDMLNNTLISTAITSMYGGYSDPGSYQTIAFSSTEGVSGFRISGGWIEGNTSIDNVVVNTSTTSVPEPSSLLLLTAGIAGLGFSRRRKA